MVPQLALSKHFNRQTELGMSEIKLKIMFVDDDPINNLINKKLLIKHYPQVEISEFLSAEEALQALHSDRLNLPHLILLDINMPEIDGWAFLNQYRRLGLSIPVFMLTSSIDQEDIKKAKEYPEINQFIVKPLDKEKAKIIFGQ